MRYFYVILALGLALNAYAQNPYVTGNTIICPGDELKLFAGGDTSYTWVLASQPNSIISTQSWVSIYPDVGDTVILYTSTDTIISPVYSDPYQCDYHCYVPNQFTPNGDVFNDKFCPILYGKEILGCRLTIVNRAGQTIFDETALYPPCWDGTHQKLGHILESDIYVWFFSYIREDNTTSHLAGSVILGK